MKKYALQIAKAHTGEDGVRKEIPDENIDYKNVEINLRFLGAVLRFADELEEGEVRVDNKYYDTMEDQIPDDQKIYWETSRCIKRITPNPKECIINIRAKINQENLFKLFTKGKECEKKVALIDELAFRVDKMNQERMYYTEFVRKHIEYREIIFDLTIEKDSHKKFTFRFNNDNGYDEFWDNYSEINPENKIEGYNLQKEMKK